MKLSKTLATVITTTVAVFGIGHVRALVAHGQFGCAAASAQSWDGGNSEADDDAPEPDKKGPPPAVGGEWEGELDDSVGGLTSIEMMFNQRDTKLSGDWDSGFGGSTFKGSINSEGDLKLDMKAGGGGCHLSAVGELVTEGEIMLTYKVESCKGSKHEHGSIDIFLE